MPIIRIEALAGAPADLDGLLRATAVAAADALATTPDRCWVTFRAIEDHHYFEDGRSRTASEAMDVSPLVRLSLRVGRPDEAIRKALRAIAVAVGDGLGVPPDIVFVECYEIPEGRVHTGGQVY
jgi:hypothetical protein